MSDKKEQLEELEAERVTNRRARIQFEREYVAPFHTRDMNLSRDIASLQNQMLQQAQSNVGYRLSPGTWKCEESPIGVCAYAIEEDPCCDQCVFCGDPEERK